MRTDGTFGAAVVGRTWLFEVTMANKLKKEALLKLLTKLKRNKELRGVSQRIGVQANDWVYIPGTSVCLKSTRGSIAWVSERITTFFVFVFGVRFKIQGFSTQRCSVVVVVVVGELPGGIHLRQHLANACNPQTNYLHVLSGAPGALGSMQREETPSGSAHVKSLSSPVSNENREQETIVFESVVRVPPPPWFHSGHVEILMSVSFSSYAIRFVPYSSQVMW